MIQNYIEIKIGGCCFFSSLFDLCLLFSALSNYLYTYLTLKSSTYYTLLIAWYSFFLFFNYLFIFLLYFCVSFTCCCFFFCKKLRDNNYEIQLQTNKKQKQITGKVAWKFCSLFKKKKMIECPSWRELLVAFLTIGFLCRIIFLFILLIISLQKKPQTPGWLFLLSLLYCISFCTSYCNNTHTHHYFFFLTLYYLYSYQIVVVSEPIFSL